MRSPVCSVPPPTAPAPNHTMATEVRFITSIMEGIMKAMARLVNSWVRMRRREASSKRASS